MSIHHCWVEEQEDSRCKGLEISWRKELQKRRLDARDVEILVTLKKLASCQRLEKMVRQLHLRRSPRKGKSIQQMKLVPPNPRKRKFRRRRKAPQRRRRRQSKRRRRRP
ncbi:hypothetical protein PVAP13_5NG256900 [Panicum virgatum]|uniref:Uncharacterized protein n=1 Tax=Panicum virgatum TaxID=38727 RepID=A0A8T0RVE9_PANVG|nr:hypothetical protein PVAP13_5NG256900 [Panicum virgatum]